MWASATDLVEWSKRREAQALLPQLLRRMVYAVTTGACRIAFRSGEGVVIGGWDGLVQTPVGHAFVPVGQSAWELSTEPKPGDKADNDYTKRTAKPPDGVVPAETVFVFVTSRRWRQKGAWEAKRRAEGVWRDVKAYDADDLEHWLEQVPAARLWLGSILGRKPSGVETLESFLRAWTQEAEPELCPEVVLVGREQSAELVTRWLKHPASSLVVHADSTDEAIAFFAAVVSGLPEEDRMSVVSRALVITDADVWRELSAHQDKLVLVGALPAVLPAGAVARGHHVLIPTTDVIMPGAISLMPPDRESFVRALGKMGIAEARARTLARESSQRPSVLRRLLAKTPTTTAPAWAAPEIAVRLAPLALVGGWDSGSGADRAMVERVTGLPYGEAEALAVRWSQEADPAFRADGSQWRWIARDDAWRWLAPSLARSHMERFQEAAIEVLKEIHPKYDLPAEERWMAAVKGRTQRYSDLFLEGLAETLGFLAVRPESLRIRDVDRPVDRVRVVVRAVLSSTDWRLWGTLRRLLAILAEAAPDEFLTATEKLVSDDPQGRIGPLLENEGPFGGSALYGLLWGLELCAWSTAHLGRVAMLLAEIARVNRPGGGQNSAAAVLRATFLPWLPKTEATLEQRLAVLDRLAQSHPEIVWPLLLGLLPKSGGDSSTQNLEARWREWGKAARRVFGAEYWDAVQQIALKIIVLVQAHPARWADLLPHIHELPRTERDRALDLLAELGHTEVPDADRTAIWSALRSVLNSHRQFASAGWALDAQTVARLATIYEHFQPRDMSARYAWLFTDNVRLPNPEGNWGEREEALRDARRDAVVALNALGGPVLLGRFTETVEHPYVYGFSLGLTGVDGQFDDTVFRMLLSGETVTHRRAADGFVVGRFESGGWTWAEAQLVGAASREYSSAQLAQIACGLPFVDRTWRLAKQVNREVEQAYWATVPVWRTADVTVDLQVAVQTLLSVRRPYSALTLLGRGSGFRACDPDLVASVLDGIAKPESSLEAIPLGGQLLTHDVAEAFAFLRENGLEDKRLAVLEWQLLPLIVRQGDQPSQLHNYLERDPSFFAEVVSLIYRSEEDGGDEPVSEEVAGRAHLAYDLLTGWAGVPASEAGVIDPVKLQAWTMAAREACQAARRGPIGDEKIGEVLARAVVGEDGVWPPRAVREVIEQVRSESVETGLFIGRLRLMGTSTRAIGEGGRQERNLAEEYRRHAAACGPGFLRTVAILNRLAESYEADARREDARNGADRL